MLKKILRALQNALFNTIGFIFTSTVKLFEVVLTFVENRNFISALLLSLFLIPSTLYALGWLMNKVTIPLIQDMFMAIIILYVVSFVGMFILFYKFITADDNFSEDYPKPTLHEIRMIPRILLIAGIFCFTFIPLDAIIFFVYRIFS